MSPSLYLVRKCGLQNDITVPLCHPCPGKYLSTRVLSSLASPTVPSRCRFAVGFRKRFCTGSEGAVMRGAGRREHGAGEVKQPCRWERVYRVGVGDPPAAARRCARALTPVGFVQPSTGE